MFKHVFIATNIKAILTQTFVGRGCRILRLCLYIGVRSTYEYSRYDFRLFDGEAPVMQELSGFRCTSSMPSLQS